MSMKQKIISAGIFLLFVFVVTGKISGQHPADKHPRVLEKDFYRGTVLRAEFISENLIRIQIVPDGSKYNESGLNRYGFIRDLHTDNLKVKITESKNGFSAVTSRLVLTANDKTGEITITDAVSKKILLKQIKTNFTDSSSLVVFKADNDEDWVGFGDQSRERLYHRGYLADCHIRSVKSYIPVPFFMSTIGVGVLVNTSHRVTFDMCKSDPDNYSWADESGNVDYYVMAGEDFNELLDVYTELTGKPKLPPEWSFGLWYLCHTRADDYEVVNEALKFREEEIPCDVIGLEPGWMENFYDYSIEKTWSKERFPIPPWAFNGPHTFINALDRMGFKIELWLCNDYDLTYEEERRIGRNESVDSRPKSTDTSHHNTGMERGDPGQSISWDTLTKKDEPWFDHLEKFTDQGIDFFKQDGAKQVHQHPGRIWGNGMTDAQVHNLYPILYSRQMYEGFAAHTNRRPVVFLKTSSAMRSWFCKNSRVTPGNVRCRRFFS